MCSPGAATGDGQCVLQYRLHGASICNCNAFYFKVLGTTINIVN